MQARGERADPKRPGEARGRPPRCRAWLRGDMVSSNKAGFNLRENLPLPRNTLHSVGIGSYDTRGCERASRFRARRLATEVSNESRLTSKVERGYLTYLLSVRDTAKSGMGCVDNRHLNHLAESLLMNRGGLHQNGKASSLLMSGVSVGGSIVVRARESRVHGEAAIRSLEMTRRVRDGGLRSKRSLITWVS